MASTGKYFAFSRQPKDKIYIACLEHGDGLNTFSTDFQLPISSTRCYLYLRLLLAVVLIIDVHTF